MLKNIAVLDSKDHGITVTEGNPNIRETIIYSCYICGLNILDFASGTYEKCEIVNTKNSAIEVYEKSNPLVKNCKIYESHDGNGIRIYGESSGTYENCEIFKTKYVGIEVAEKSNPQVKACKIHNILDNNGVQLAQLFIPGSQNNGVGILVLILCGDGSEGCSGRIQTGTAIYGNGECIHGEASFPETKRLGKSPVLTL